MVKNATLLKKLIKLNGILKLNEADQFQETGLEAKAARDQEESKFDSQ